MNAAEANKKQVAQATQSQAGIDKLVVTAITAGTAALTPMRVGVRKALAASQTPDELRHHLIELLYAQSAQALAKQLMRAKTMGQMAGVVAVLDETEG